MPGPIEVLCIFWRGLGVFNEKNGEATEGRGSIVKCGDGGVSWSSWSLGSIVKCRETLLDRGEGGGLKIPWNPPCVTVL